MQNQKTKCSKLTQLLRALLLDNIIRFPKNRVCTVVRLWLRCLTCLSKEELRHRKRADVHHSSKTAQRATTDRAGVRRKQEEHKIPSAVMARRLNLKNQKGASRRHLQLPACGQMCEYPPHFAGNSGPELKKLACDHKAR